VKLSKAMGFSNLTLLFLLAFFLVSTISVQAASRHDPAVAIGDITRIEGARNNQLVGYGLVTGLDGSGDSTRSQATVQSISNMLSQFGVEVDPDQVEGRNIAAVMVTADLPHDASTGDQIDVQVSSIGDASSLEGGMLVQTPLEAATGEIYTVAQGPVSVGGPDEDGAGQDGSHPTSAVVPDGGIVERSIDYRLDGEEITLVLDEGNFRTASTIVDTVNTHFADITGGADIARAETESRIDVEVPGEYQNNIVEFIAELNGLEVEPTTEARVVVNESKGTVVKGHEVSISTVSVSHDNLSVEIAQDTSLEEDNDEEFIAEEQEMEIEDQEQEDQVMIIEGGSTINDLVTALNAIGADASSLATILQEIDAAGALHAELEVR